MLGFSITEYNANPNKLLQIPALTVPTKYIYNKSWQIKKKKRLRVFYAKCVTISFNLRNLPNIDELVQ